LMRELECMLLLADGSSSRRETTNTRERDERREERQLASRQNRFNITSLLLPPQPQMSFTGYLWASYCIGSFDLILDLLATLESTKCWVLLWFYSGRGNELPSTSIFGLTLEKLLVWRGT
jgi:hypothetical protein